MIKIIKRYGGAILFAIVAAMKLAKLTAAQEYEFAGIFCLWVILSFFEGWLTHCLYINSELIKLHNDNIRYMKDNMKLMDQLKEEREKNGTEGSKKDS